jgi:formiminoglutamase
MTQLTPPDVALPHTAADDPRVGHLFGTRLTSSDQPDVVIVGFPSDEGVRRNGGRVGAARGTAAIRAALYRMAPDARSERLEQLLSRSRDLGDLPISGDVETDQRQLARPSHRTWIAAHLWSCSAADTRRPTDISWAMRKRVVRWRS